jgi:hypothetical protein
LPWNCALITLITYWQNLVLLFQAVVQFRY